MSIVAIDQGTTSTRALVLPEAGAPRIAHAVAHRQIYPHPGHVEHDPEELLANIRACLDAAGPARAIGLANQGESCLAWDAVTKEALSPVLVWQDDRTAQAIARLKGEGAEAETLARAGLPLDSYFSASKLAWIVAERPEARHALERGRLRLGTTDAFFLDRLAGRFVTDVATASRTSLMNLETLAWDPELCRLFGVPIAALPEIVATTGDLAAVETAHGRVPVTASLVDQQAALYGHGCRMRGQAKTTFGTGAFTLMVTGAEIVRAPEEGLLPTVAWRRAGEPPVYALDGGVFSASAAVNWAKAVGLVGDLAALDRLEGPPALASGLAFVPALSGLACPHWDRRARGTFLGLSLETRAEDMAKAVLEGVALRTAEVLAAMAARIPLAGPLSIDGGMAANPYFRGFLADVAERDIVVAANPELTAAGVGRLAAEAAGIALPPDPPGETVSPRRRLSGLAPRFARAVALSRSWGDAGTGERA